MSYVFDANTDPNERTRRRRLAEALMLKATDAGPIASPWQGAAKMAQALMGGIELGQYDKQDRLGQESAKADMEAAMNGGGVTARPQVPSPVAAALANPPSFTQTGGKMAQAPSDLAPYFDEASKMTGIPASVLMAKVQQESRFNPNAIGKAGEVGLAQIMPSTARDPGFGMQGVDPQSLRDPRTNIMFGAQYLAARGKAAGVTDWNDRNQVAKALTAYNGGGDPNYAQHVMRFMPGQGAPSRVAGALAGGGGQPTMAGGDTLAQPTQLPSAAPATGLMGAGQDTASQQASILKALQNPYISPAQKQVLTLRYQSLQKDPMQALTMQKTQLDIDAAKQAAAKNAVMTPLEVAKAQRDLQKPLIDPTTADKDYTKAMADRKARGLPDVPYDDWLTSYKKSGAQNVTIDQKTEGEFEKKVAEGQAKLFNGMAEEGVNAKAELGQIRTLRGQIEALPGGFLGGAQALASQYGIKLGPQASNIEAAQAIISKLVPSQKAPGSGTISDRDLDLFKSSLPALSNTPGGNKMILDTMEALSIHKQRQSDIATQVLTGEMTRKDAMKALRDMPDPLEAVTKSIREMKKAGPAGGVSAGPPAGVDPKIWQHMTPEERKLWN